MTATLWLDTEKDETLELGGTCELYTTFQEMAKAAGPNYLMDYPALFAVVNAVESQADVPRDYQIDLANEATAFLQTYGRLLGEDAVWLLGQLRTLKGAGT